VSEFARMLGILDEFRVRLWRLFLVLGPLFGSLLAFQIRQGTLPRVGIPIWYPYPNLFDNVTAQIFRGLVGLMLPPGAVLLNLGVGDSVVAQMEIALLVTVSLGMPWIAHELGAFLVPALRAHERELLRQVAGPATALFLLGFLLALFWLTPLTFRFLFRYVAAMGLEPNMGVQSFLTFALLYTLAFGIVFELPVFIYALTRANLVPARAWRRHWRAAVMACLVFGMVITPDNSGITMLLIATPMIALYFGGAWFAERYERQKERAPRNILGRVAQGGPG
jgi:sec-independent protein translocase protein TatC